MSEEPPGTTLGQRSFVDRWIGAIPALSVAFLGLCLALIAAASMSWRVMHDSPLMLYAAFLMDRFGYVPYRDFFDMNMPGTYFFYYLLGRIFGYSDTAMRVVDLGCLVAIMAVTGMWMRRFGALVAAFGALLFGLVYLSAGPPTSMQRDYILLLPLAGALWLFSSKLSTLPRLAGVGGLFGLVATIKPQAVIGLPVLLAFELWPLRRRSDPGAAAGGWVRGLAATTIGFAIPLLVGAAYLLATGALGAFFDLALGYLPLYAQLDGFHRASSGGGERIVALILGFLQLGGAKAWVGTAALGTLVALYPSTLSESRQRDVKLLLALAVVYSVYPAITGQFWDYHWTPFLYFMALLSALGLVRQPTGAPRLLRLLPMCALWFALLIPQATAASPYILRGGEMPAPKGGRVDRIAAVLKERAQPGDRAQALDWTGGAIHAILIAELETATPFIYDFHFYHHVSTDYSQGLRKRFIESFAESRPRFVVEITTDKPWPRGDDTSRSFPQLRQILASDYEVAQTGDGWVVHERR